MYLKHITCHQRTLNDTRKNATYKTKKINHKIYKKIDWNKLKLETKLAKEGRLVNTHLPVIRRENSKIPVWDLRRYAFLLKDKLPDTVNPKLWEQGKLNLNTGLFRVTDNIYQVRGFDAANMTFIKGDTGWIVIDALTCKETAEAAINLINEHLGQRPISAVIITHSHVDHYGGSLGVINNLATKDTKFFVPENYSSAVIDENVYAGVAMFRRAKYQYGIAMQRDEKGQVDIGIGKGLSTGTITYSQNVVEIKQEYQVLMVDGVAMEFLLALNTEAPAEMFIYIPCEHSLCIAEDCNATLHNLLTLRGAKVRDAVAWSQSIQKSIDLWGTKMTTVFGVHNWPRFSNLLCLEYLEKQRDFYQYINDQTLRLMNQGYTIEEIGRMVKVPKSIAGEWYNSEFYGTVIHNVKAVYQRFLGWYNSNPVDLNKLMPEDSAKKYVEYMGGEDRVIKKAMKAYREGEYQWVAEVMKQVIYANSNNRKARLLCADALEQLGYIAESGAWRNEYLKGAQELRHGIIPSSGSIISENVLNNIPLKNVLNLLSIRLKGYQAGNVDFKINFIIPDRQEGALMEINRGVLRYLSDKLSEDVAVTVTMSKNALYELATTNQIPDDIFVEGDMKTWKLFVSLIDTINPDFSIITPVPK